MLDVATPPPSALPVTPRLALVGRPNVGKSAIFNRLVGRRVALVLDEPHVTRDRLFGSVELGRGRVDLIDTGGLLAPEAATCGATASPAAQIYSHVAAQTQVAIEMADWVLLVVDGAAGCLPGDEQIATTLRRAGKLVVVLVNKVDTPEHGDRLHDFFRLGFEHLVALSAEHARGFGDLEDLLCGLLGPRGVHPDEAPNARLAAVAANCADDPGEAAAVGELAEEAPASRILWQGAAIRVAVVGRPNAGKSSLINALLGEDRHLACDIAGATRDAVDSAMRHGDQDFVFVDTAGMRRKRGIVHRLEQLAVASAVRSIEQADVVVLLLDGTLVPAEQDVRLAAMAHQRGKGLIIAANKWECVDNPQWQEGFVKTVRTALPFADYAPLITLSAKTGAHLDALCQEVVAVQQERHRRVSTGELNRFFRRVVESHPPPRSGGTRPRLYYVSQPMVAPPTFIFATNKMDKVHFSYQRYLANCLREAYGFNGTPLWVKFRQR